MKLSEPPESRCLAGATAYRVPGAGQTIVLIPGAGMNQRAWQPRIAALSQQRGVVTGDLLGNGESQLPPEGVQRVDFAAQLLQLLDHLQIGQAHVLGHSMGALLALRGLAQAGPGMNLTDAGEVDARLPRFLAWRAGRGDPGTRMRHA